MNHDLSSYQKLTDTEHILLRPNMYLGSADEVETEDYFFDEKENKFVQKKVTYVPGLLKIINEIIDNSIDEAVRTKFAFGNKISVNISDTEISIVDNGRGIPVELMQGTDEYIPVVLFTEAKAGSNFKDDKRTTIGMNGIGSTITNVFSTKFEVVTQDGKKKLHLTCKDNNSSCSHKISSSTKQGTEVTFTPDLKRFKLTTISDVYKSVIFQRLLLLSICYPSIKFSFNGNKIKTLDKASFLSMFAHDFEFWDDEEFFFAITLSETDDFRHFTYVNGLYIKEGGNHITLIANEIVSRLRDKLEKKYPGIKPGDIKNKLRVIAFFNNFPNPKYNSQTKENLTNSNAEIKEYMKDVDYDKLIKVILKNEYILSAIEETHKIKEELKKRQELRSLSATPKRLNIDKFTPSIESSTYLTLAEGDSATTGLLPILGRKQFAYFSLKGKPLNVENVTISKIAANEEMKNLISIMGVDISKEVKAMNYDNILIASDQDLDGILIRGLLLAFFNKFMPDLIRQGRIKYLKTPMIALYKKNVPQKWFFNFTEYNAWLSKNSLTGYEFKYYKGLGTWEPDHLKHIFATDGFDKFVETFVYDKTSQDYITKWMHEAYSDERKAFLRGLSFNMEKL